MNIVRSSRKKDDDRRKEQVAAKRRGRVRAILDLLGLWDGLGTTTLRERLLHCYYPRVEVTLADDAPPSDETAALLREMGKTVKRATFNCPIMGEKFSTTEYFSYVKPVMDVLHAAVSDNPELRVFLKAAQDCTRDLGSANTAAVAICELFRELDEVLIKVGRIDQHLYYLKCEHGRKPNDQWFVRFVLKVGEPEKRWVEPKGEKGRWAFRCGQPFGMRGIEWVAWPPLVLGLQGEEPTYPVYVQSHALDNLYRKEARALFIEDGEWLVHDYLWQSLREPKVTPMPRAPGKFLVEYHLNCHKLGYLVAQPLDGIVLIESFLFITMDGTPEGDELWNNLRLRRRDKEHLELDQIHTFLMTDVQFDPDLVAILEKCGCGHLFRVMKEPPRDRFVPGYANEFRKYLRLDG